METQYVGNVLQVSWAQRGVHAYITNHIKVLSKHSDIEAMFVSDHGATSVGRNTYHAYGGCTRPVSADSALDMRRDTERILKAGPSDD